VFEFAFHSIVVSFLTNFHSLCFAVVFLVFHFEFCCFEFLLGLSCCRGRGVILGRILIFYMPNNNL